MRIIFLSLLLCANIFSVHATNDSLLYKLEHEQDPTLKIELLKELYLSNRNKSSDSFLIYLDRAFKDTSIDKNPVNVATKYTDQAEVLLFLAQYKAVKPKLDFADSIYLAENNIPGQIRVKHIRGSLAALTGKYNSALNRYNEAAKMAAGLNDNTQHLTSKINIALALSKKGEFNKSLRVNSEILELRRIKNDSSTLSIIFNNMASLWFLKNDFYKAMQYNLKALEIQQKNKNPTAYTATFNAIADAYVSVGHEKKAIDYYQQALDNCKDVGDESDELETLLKIANFNLSSGKDKDARKYLIKAFPLTYELEENQLRASFHNSNAWYFYRNFKFKKAIQEFVQAIELIDSTQMQHPKLNAYHGLSSCFYLLKEYEKSEYYAHHTLEMSKKLGAKQNQAHAALLLGKIYGKQNDLRLSNYYFDIYAQQMDSLNVREQVSNMQAAIFAKELEKKELENQLLQTDRDKQSTLISSQDVQIRQKSFLFTLIVILTLIIIGFVLFLSYVNKKQRTVNLKLLEQGDKINEQNIELKENNEFKNKMLSIISHDVRGPLRNLKQIFLLYEKGHINPEEISKVRSQILSNLDNSIVLLDNMLYWAKSQLDGLQVKNGNIDLHQMTDEVLSLLGPLAKDKGIDVTNRLNGEDFAFADKEMVSVIIRNLISNAIKFTKVGGSIDIYAKHSNDRKSISFNVKDTGIGMSEDAIQRVFARNESFTNTGTLMEKGTGLGLLISKEFAELNKGKLSVASKEGKGSIFSLKLNKV